MESIHVVNIEEYQPAYKDRDLLWIRWDIRAMGKRQIFTLDVTAKWLFVCLICLETEAQKPITHDVIWLESRTGIKKCFISKAIHMLQEKNLIVIETLKVCNEDLKSLLPTYLHTDIQTNNTNIQTIYVDWEQSTLTAWNSFVEFYPILSRIQELSEKRRTKLKKRFEKKSFQDFNKILENIKTSPFLLGENPRNWKITFDWLIENDTNYLKVIEGRYLDKKQTSADDIRTRLGLKKE